ncbi:MAG: HupE/UreJ family protein [Gammaproteobacteria bacterium]|nr:HupE/UreJ family protein [Gammaproteobacteria bacterium]
MSRARQTFIVLALLAVPGSAFAHTAIKGANNFFNGFLHPVVVPAHLLLLIAVGLFFGQQKLKEIHMPLMVFLLSTMSGLVATTVSRAYQVEDIILAGAAIVGLLIAIAHPIKLFWISTVGAVAGFLLGFDSMQDTLFGVQKYVGLFGSAVGIYCFSLYPMLIADYFKKKPWQKIGIRVIGSWIAASALLVLALSMSAARL